MQNPKKYTRLYYPHCTESEAEVYGNGAGEPHKTIHYMAWFYFHSIFLEPHFLFQSFYA